MNKKFKNINNNKILNYYQLNKFFYKTSKQIPFIKKITTNFDQKSTNFKQITAAHLALEILFFQKSIFTEINQSNVIYKIKKGQPVGCKITINNKIKTIETLNILLKVLIENENDINLKINKLKHNTLNFSILEIYNCNKLENYYLLFNKLKKLNVSFVISSKNKSYNESLYLIHIILFKVAQI